MQAVIDTNVVYAGLFNRKGAAYKIIKRFFGRQFDWIYSSSTLDEYREVLSASPKLSTRRVSSFISRFFREYKEGAKVHETSRVSA